MCILGESFDVRSVDITGNQIFSNQSWGIFLRNSNVSTVQRNNIFRNDCGGLRVCLNRFDRTIVMKNNIHDHTGPGLCQTTFFSESQEQISIIQQNRIAKAYNDGRISDEKMEELGHIRPLDRDTNSVPIMEMENVYDNNDLSYGSIKERMISVEKNCSFCSRQKAEKPCNKCRKVWYCNNECQKSHYEVHKARFCSYFEKNHILNITLTPADIKPSNNLITEFVKKGKKKRVRDYKKLDQFLIKITAGADYFGLDKSINKLKSDEEPEGDVLFVYDKLRFVCGTIQNDHLYEFVRQYGKLCGEKIFSRRIYLFAKIVGSCQNNLEVRTDEMKHELGW